MATILVIDDEQMILEYLKTIMTNLGYDVITACDGVAGCDAAANQNVNLIISDLNIPGEISGINFVKKLRALRPNCPIVILTGYPTDTRLQEAKELHAEFLTKPFEIPFLGTVLKRLLPLDSESGSTPVAPK